MCMWCPTARDLTDNAGQANSTVYESGRTASTIYLRLLSERMRLSTNDSQPWLWRRIVVATKNPFFRSLDSTESGGSKNNRPFIETSSGFGRLFQQWDLAAGSAQSQRNVLETLFRGKQGKDWSDPLIAPIDTLNITKLYDKTTSIRSGNDSGIIRLTRRTHTFNRTFRYGEDENGEFQDTSYWSPPGKGMGDVFIIDFFSSTISTASSLLRVDSEATLYWHER